MKDKTLLLGAHMSIAGGFQNAILDGEAINCTTIQIFLKSNRQWSAKKITQEQINLFKQAYHNSSIRSIMAHCTYLINLGSIKQDIVHKSIEAVSNELTRCEQLNIPYLVLHPGSGTTPTQECLQQIADNLNYIFENNKSKTIILLENMAGHGNSVCYKFEHIATLYDLSKYKKRLGTCFDTCHAFAAGYDFRTPKEYELMWKEFDSIIGLKTLKAIHLNDSKKDLGSRVDRHEEIGKGKIGFEAFTLIMNDERLLDIPKILETPKKELIDYARNMTVLKKLLSLKTRKLLNVEID